MISCAFSHSRSAVPVSAIASPVRSRRSPGHQLDEARAIETRRRGEENAADNDQQGVGKPASKAHHETAGIRNEAALAALQLVELPGEADAIEPLMERCPRFGQCLADLLILAHQLGAEQGDAEPDHGEHGEHGEEKTEPVGNAGLAVKPGKALEEGRDDDCAEHHQDDVAQLPCQQRKRHQRNDDQRSANEQPVGHGSWSHARRDAQWDLTVP